MWNRKDFIIAGLAATATFGLTLATLLPRVANATAESPTTIKIVSPVLHLTHFDIQAQADSLPALDTPVPNSKAAQRSASASNVIRLSAGAVPTIKLTVTNASDQETSTSFAASLMVTSAGGFSRVAARPKPLWSQNYNVVLKAHESRDIQVDTQVSLANGNFAQLALQAPAGDETAWPITALTFNVTGESVPAPTSPVAKAPSPVASAK